jgi:hypothetical protein
LLKRLPAGPFRDTVSTTAAKVAAAAATKNGTHAIVVVTSSALVSPATMAPTTTFLIGDSKLGRLYAVYSAAEQLGVRFELHSDILPDPTQVC